MGGKEYDVLSSYIYRYVVHSVGAFDYGIMGIERFYPTKTAK